MTIFWLWDQRSLQNLLLSILLTNYNRFLSRRSEIFWLWCFSRENIIFPHNHHYARLYSQFQDYQLKCFQEHWVSQLWYSDYLVKRSWNPLLFQIHWNCFDCKEKHVYNWINIKLYKHPFFTISSSLNKNNYLRL